MRDFLSITRKLGGMASACFMVSAICGLPAYGQQSSQNNTASVVIGQKQENQAEKIRINDKNMAHRYFKEMGMSGAAGVFQPRLAGLKTRAEIHKDGNFTSHCGTGLTKFIDPQVINDRFPANPRTVAVFQFEDVTSKIGTTGFSPLIESKTSTPLGDGKRSNTLVGFSTLLPNSRAIFNPANITTLEIQAGRQGRAGEAAPQKPVPRIERTHEQGVEIFSPFVSYLVEVTLTSLVRFTICWPCNPAP